VSSTRSAPAHRERFANSTNLAAGTHLLFALDAATGAEIWRWQSPAGVKQQVNIGAVANGIVYVVSYDHGVYALDAKTGADRWLAPFMTKGLIGAVAGFVDGTLYVPNSDRHLYLIDATSGGAMAPPFPLQGDPSGPAIIDGRLFLATTLGRLMCITGT
jgi:outer membrane protein assembly factor BamB